MTDFNTSSSIEFDDAIADAIADAKAEGWTLTAPKTAAKPEPRKVCLDCAEGAEGFDDHDREKLVNGIGRGTIVLAACRIHAA